MDGIMFLSKLFVFKTMHDLGKLISSTIFWERKKNERHIKNIKSRVINIDRIINKFPLKNLKCFSLSC